MEIERGLVKRAQVMLALVQTTVTNSDHPRRVRHHPHAPGARIPAARGGHPQLTNPDFAALAQAYDYAGVRITRSADFEREPLAALGREAGTLIEIMLEPELITTRGTLSGIAQAALAKH